MVYLLQQKFPDLQYVWPDLPKGAIHAHNGKVHFSPSLDDYGNKLTSCLCLLKFYEIYLVMVQALLHYT